MNGNRSVSLQHALSTKPDKKETLKSLYSTLRCYYLFTVLSPIESFAWCQILGKCLNSMSYQYIWWWEGKTRRRGRRRRKRMANTFCSCWEHFGNLIYFLFPILLTLCFLSRMQSIEIILICLWEDFWADKIGKWIIREINNGEVENVIFFFKTLTLSKLVN